MIIANDVEKNWEEIFYFFDDKMGNLKNVNIDLAISVDNLEIYEEKNSKFRWKIYPSAKSVDEGDGKTLINLKTYEIGERERVCDH